MLVVVVTRGILISLITSSSLSTICGYKMDSFLDTFKEKNSASPSFIENLCPGENCLSKTEGNGAKTSLIYKDCMPRPTKSRSGGVGGYTCCVPGCYNNSKKQRNVSFHTFPNGKSNEKKLLRKKWINLLSRKEVVPTSGHRVCSEHFKGGKKTYLNNVPIRTPKTTNMWTQRKKCGE